MIARIARSILIAGALSLPAAVTHAATFAGIFWDADRSFGNIGDVSAYIGGTDVTATFRSTGIDYPNAGGSITSDTTLADFLGADAATLSGNGDSNLRTSVFQFSGSLGLTGVQTISVGSDDGFVLKFDGIEVLGFSKPRAFGYTTGSFDLSDVKVFELTYYENYGNTGVEFLIDGTVVNPSMAPAPVPVPAALPLLGAAIAVLGGVRRLRRG
jgi:hypothetical protein